MPFDDNERRPQIRAESRFPATGVTVMRAVSTGPEAAEARRQLWSNYATGVHFYYYVRMAQRSWSTLTRPDQVNDIAQDFLVHFFADRPDGPPRVTGYRPREGAFRDFVCGCARHFGIDWSQKQTTLKRGGGTQTLALDPDWMGRAVQDCESPEEALDRGWALGWAQRAAARLAEAGKFPWLGSVQAHLASREILDRPLLAKELNISPGNLKVRLHRLCADLEPHLRELIGEVEADPERVDLYAKAVFALLGLKNYPGGV